MTTRYDDFQIISPNKMDSIAKEYFKEINEKYKMPHPSLQSLKDYEHFCINVGKAIKQIENLSYQTSSKFYARKKEFIKKILLRLNALPSVPETNLKKPETYCSGLVVCIQMLCSATKNCINILQCNLSKEDILSINNYIYTLLNITELLPLLFGECKYRER